MSKRFCCDHIYFHREPGLNAARFWFHAVPTGFTSVALGKPHLPVHFPYNQVYSWDWSGSHLLGVFGIARYNIMDNYSSSRGLPSILVICTRESSSQTWKFWTTKKRTVSDLRKGRTWDVWIHLICMRVHVFRMFHVSPTFAMIFGSLCIFGANGRWFGSRYGEVEGKGPFFLNPDHLKMDAWGSFIYLL